MKKKQVLKKLVLNKEMISRLNNEEMRKPRGGGDKTDLGITCRTGECCETAQYTCTCN